MDAEPENAKETPEEVQRLLNEVDHMLDQRQMELKVFRSGTTALRWLVRILSILMVAMLAVSLVAAGRHAYGMTPAVVALYMSIIGFVLSGWALVLCFRAFRRTPFTGPFKIYAFIFVVYFMIFSISMLNLASPGRFPAMGAVCLAVYPGF